YFAADRPVRQWRGGCLLDGDLRAAGVHSRCARLREESRTRAMADRVEPANPPAAGAPASDRHSFAIGPLIPSGLDGVPFAANLLAPRSGFVSLMAVPWFHFQVLSGLSGDAIVADDLAASFLLLSLQETFLTAVTGALLFLVTGAILQAWHYQRPYPWRRPMW